MNDIHHLLTLCSFFPHFLSALLLLQHIRREENVINTAALYSGRHNCLTLFTMYASACFSFRDVKEKATVHHEW